MLKMKATEFKYLFENKFQCIVDGSKTLPNHHIFSWDIQAQALTH